MKFFVAIISVALFLASGHASPVHSEQMTRQSHVLLPRFQNPILVPECRDVCAPVNNTAFDCAIDDAVCYCRWANDVLPKYKPCAECSARIDPDHEALAGLQEAVNDLVKTCTDANITIRTVTLGAPETSAAARPASIVLSFALGGAACALLGVLTGL